MTTQDVHALVALRALLLELVRLVEAALRVPRTDAERREREEDD